MSAQKLQSVTRSLKHRQPSSFRKQRARPAQQADTQPISLFLLLFLNSSTICQVTCASTHVGGKIVWSRAFFRHDILFDRTKLCVREVEPSSCLWEFIESTFITHQHPIWFTCMRRLHATINRSFFLLGKTVLSFFLFFSFFKYEYTHPRRWFASSLLTEFLSFINFLRDVVVFRNSVTFQNSGTYVFTQFRKFSVSSLFVRCSYDISGFDTHFENLGYSYLSLFLLSFSGSNVYL